MNRAADDDIRREPDVIAYDITPMEEARRKLTRALDGVQDFDSGALSTSDLGASANASTLAFHHSVARAEYRKAIEEVRTELSGFLESFDEIKRGLDDVDEQGAARLRMLQSLAFGGVETPGQPMPKASAARIETGSGTTEVQA